MGKIIAISNQKGGVGKTTTAINLAAGLGYLRNKVLLVDFDPQGNASQGVGASREDGQPTVYNLLMEDYEADDVIEHLSKPPIDIIPANIAMAGDDLEMVRFEGGKEELLKKKLDPIKARYDYIIIDCPPSLGLLNTNALTAADSVMIPVQIKFGAESARVLMAGICFFFAGVVLFVQKIAGEATLDQIAELLGTITGNVPGQAGIFAVSIAVVLISYGISVRFMEKREI